MGVGVKCAQIILFIFNLILILCGLAMIIIGSIAYAKQDTIFHLTGITNGAAIFLIVVGCVLALIALFGCIGAWNKNHCMLVTYCIILVVLFIVTIIVIIVAFAVKDKINYENINNELRKTIDEYDTNKAVESTWDSVQSDNNCCGAADYDDWKLNPRFNESKSVPDSCCVTQSKGCGVNQLYNPKTINMKGCVTSLVDFTQSNFKMIGIIAIITAIILFFGILVAAYLAHEIRREYNTV